jgi:NTE family protein
LTLDSSEQPTVSSAADVSDAQRPRIGLCLSGGGFRAALFGLGVLRYLAEADRLRDIVAVSAVSGGSIAAAVLADRWPDLESRAFDPDAFESCVIAPFVDTLTTTNLRNRGVARWALTRPVPGQRRRGPALGATIAKHLLRTERVTELPSGLQVILTATDLVSGRAFRVSRDFVGGWEFGYAPTPPALRLGTVIAASTAVPFLFPPVHLRTRGLALRSTVPSRLALVDGGVYDNLGLEWFQGWDRGRPDGARPADFIVAVDASGPLQSKAKRYGWLTSLRRSQEAQYAQTRASRIRWFVDQLLAGSLRGVHVPISRDPAAFAPPPGVPPIARASDGSLPAGFASLLSGLRTDLDRFLGDECATLMYHGYWSAHVRLRHLQTTLAVEAPTWRDFAARAPGEEERLRAALIAGQRRSLWRR